ncbi:hypothetical protein [Oceanivirga miroungae]|uniref:Uncharacterized protein n=1 Tax=Oceanivirga miroungae TaxID=1130046 RepID=A0A6I8MEB5_9FUSO|nr:hypothetical protein [Oceanivirga miroungae]VWL85431.1 hypothetical protein OMES3154_00716 [Oceanivirga miroungae]
MLKQLKLISIFVLSVFTISCSTTSEQYFKRGEYINAIKTADVELAKVKDNNEKNELISRVNTIISIYENNYNLANTNYSIAESSFNLFKLLHTIEDNKQVLVNTNIQKKYNAIDILEKSIKYTKLYSKENNSLDSLYILLSKLKDEKLMGTKYLGVYQNYSKYVADKYYELAVFYEGSNNLEMALENYIKVNDSYEDFDRNYRNSSNKIYEIKMTIDLNDANKLVKKANEYYLAGNIEKSISLYKEAVSIYSRYNLDEKADIYRAIVKRLTRELDLKTARKYYDEAVNYYNLKSYKYALERFKDSYKLYDKYDDNDMKKLIEGYLEVVNFKIKEEKAKYLFDRGVNLYTNGEYENAKYNFNESKKLYISFSNLEMLKKIDLYLNAIENKMNTKNVDGEKLLENAKQYLNKAVIERNEYKVNEYYEKALDNLNAIIKLNLLPNKIDEINSYIKYIKRNKNISPNNLLYNKYFNNGLEYKKEAEKYIDVEKTNYYYTLAYENFEKALENATTKKEKDDASRYVKLIKKFIIIKEEDINLYNLYYEKAMKDLNDSKYTYIVSNRDEMYKSAIKNLNEAKKYTNDYNLINKLNSMIKEIESRITFKF